jgi:hypothetical protein
MVRNGTVSTITAAHMEGKPLIRAAMSGASRFNRPL